MSFLEDPVHIFESPIVQRIFTLKHLRQKVQEKNLGNLIFIFSILVVSFSFIVEIIRCFYGKTDLSLQIAKVAAKLIIFGAGVFAAKVGFKMANKAFSWKVFFILSFAIWWRMQVIIIVLAFIAFIPLSIIPSISTEPTSTVVDRSLMPSTSTLFNTSTVFSTSTIHNTSTVLSTSTMPSKSAFAKTLGAALFFVFVEVVLAAFNILLFPLAISYFYSKDKE